MAARAAFVGDLMARLQWTCTLYTAHRCRHAARAGYTASSQVSARHRECVSAGPASARPAAGKPSVRTSFPGGRRMAFDIVVVGAGPAGLCFARSLAGSGLRIALVERQDEAALAAPADDGREIAITHRSRQLLQSLGFWDRIDGDHIGTLREALVLDGRDRDGLIFSPALAGAQQLGWLLSNHEIRRAAFAEVATLPDVRLFAGAKVASVRM